MASASSIPSLLAAPMPLSLAGSLAPGGVAEAPAAPKNYLALNDQGIPMDAYVDDSAIAWKPTVPKAVPLTKNEMMLAQQRAEPEDKQADETAVAKEENSMSNFKCKGRGAAGAGAAEAPPLGSAGEQPGAAARVMARAARTKVKVTARRSAGPALAGDDASSSSSSSSFVPVPVMFTALTLAHANAWIVEREMWDEQDEAFSPGSQHTKQTIREALGEHDVASVLIDLILEFAEVSWRLRLFDACEPLRPRSQQGCLSFFCAVIFAIV